MLSMIVCSVCDVQCSVDVQYVLCSVCTASDAV